MKTDANGFRFVPLHCECCEHFVDESRNNFSMKPCLVRRRLFGPNCSGFEVLPDEFCENEWI